MATIKSYTDLEQSKKLAEILPLESADMYDYTANGDLYKTPNVIESKDDLYVDENSIPCWSLAALLNILPEYNLQRTDWYYKIEHKIVITTNKDNYSSKNCDNPVDACYEMIMHLNELKML